MSRDDGILDEHDFPQVDDIRLQTQAFRNLKNEEEREQLLEEVRDIIRQEIQNFADEFLHQIKRKVNFHYESYLSGKYPMNKIIGEADRDIAYCLEAAIESKTTYEKRLETNAEFNILTKQADERHKNNKKK